MRAENYILMRIKVESSNILKNDPMYLNYKIMSTFRPGEGKSGQKLWFPKLTGSKQIGLGEVADLLSKRTTASGADVILVVNALIDLIPELLAGGNTVRLDGLGVFRLHARVTASELPELVSAKNIRELRLSFIPDKEIKEQLQKIQVKPVK